MYLSKAITASQLISLGIKVGFDKSNSQMKLTVSDKLSLKFNQFKQGKKSKKGAEKTSVILELDCPFENFESPIKYFEIEDKDSTVFEFIRNEIFTSIGVYLKTEQELFDVERDMTIYAMGFHEILYTDTVFNLLKEYIMGSYFYESPTLDILTVNQYFVGNYEKKIILGDLMIILLLSIFMNLIIELPVHQIILQYLKNS